MTFTLKLVQRKALASRVFELVFFRPEGLTFRPGEHLRFHHQGLERDYTPVSLAGEETIRICVRQRAKPGFSTFLSACDMGTGFEVSGPHGHFVLADPAPASPPAVFMGTGTGIAPFVAFAGAGAKGYTLLQGARTPEELVYREEVRKNSSLYVPCISQDLAGVTGAFFQGRVTDYLDQHLPRGKYLFYLCGRRQMILDTMDMIDEKFPDSRVFAERFS